MASPDPEVAEAPRPKDQAALGSPRNLLAITDGTAPELFGPALASLADGLDAVVTLMVVASVPDARDYSPPVEPEQLRRCIDDITRSAERRLTDVRQAVDTAGRIETRLLAAPAEELALLVAAAARHADVALFPGNYGCGNQHLRERLICTALDEAGCPVLIVRDRPALLPACRAAVAWNGSRACSRAWRDATRLVRPGSPVEIGIGGVIAASRAGDMRLSELAAAHFGRQGYSARVHELPLHPAGDEWRPPGERLLEFERGLGPDLMVMGAGAAVVNGRPGLSALTQAMIANGESHLLIAR